MYTLLFLILKIAHDKNRISNSGSKYHNGSKKKLIIQRNAGKVEVLRVRQKN